MSDVLFEGEGYMRKSRLFLKGKVLLESTVWDRKPLLYLKTIFATPMCMQVSWWVLYYHVM